ncbi:hypothetical protein DM02DRAFT_232818 [Periconia macrospinosa]|uniref:Uncharacterized protein n=1 Tax=Periconia macrospinosa TaxID=97972 RepID=A0A2V1EB82_9PLEO|nr:hypothetical protein DM02DRAFT_232818 [Periconia macrospinosa]
MQGVEKGTRRSRWRRSEEASWNEVLSVCLSVCLCLCLTWPAFPTSFTPAAEALVRFGSGTTPNLNARYAICCAFAWA